MEILSQKPAISSMILRYPSSLTDKVTENKNIPSTSTLQILSGVNGRSHSLSGTIRLIQSLRITMLPGNAIASDRTQTSLQHLPDVEG